MLSLSLEAFELTLACESKFNFNPRLRDSEIELMASFVEGLKLAPDCQRPNCFCFHASVICIYIHIHISLSLSLSSRVGVL